MTIVNESLILNSLVKEESFDTIGDFSNYILETFNNMSLTEAFTFKKDFDKKVKTFERTSKDSETRLAALGVDVRGLKSIVKKDALVTARKLKTIPMTKEGMVKGSKIIQNQLAETKKTVYDVFVSNFAKEVDQDNSFLTSLIILSTVISINSFMSILLTVLFGPLMGNVLTAVFVAPITEEIGKLTAVKVDENNGKKNSGRVYNIVFNATEFTMYVTRLMSMGFAPATAIGVRIPAIIMHTVNQLIIRFGYKSDIEKGKDKDVAGSTASFVTMLIHGLFNFTAVITEL